MILLIGYNNLICAIAFFDQKELFAFCKAIASTSIRLKLRNSLDIRGYMKSRLLDLSLKSLNYTFNYTYN
jgi:uncharacterized protein YifN (PemK superfamily)